MAEDEFAAANEPVKRRYAFEQTFHQHAPILVDRARLEQRLTEGLIEHMRRDGVELDPSTRLPGFSLHRNLDDRAPHLVLARVECEVWMYPPGLIGAIARD